MEMLRDDFRRLPDGSIDYNFYRASAAEFRREENKRLILAAIRGDGVLLRDAMAAALRVFSTPGKLGSARR